ncbi:ATP-dependent nuclease subunit B [uncultured Meiothermus sp.]|uniref:ATP-dependent nuclease subunit B n=1 Tax=uncultured Meiothermus sp. TaxID=157471 RepID=UPI0026316C68|nr:ATP-dependent nuclease subunit B [uncultured Meiothermus sp.]
MHLLVGPPASSKTTRLLEVAQSFLLKRKRVWWVCLPAQKAYVYRRATQGGAVLGLEVLTSQQLYYRLLAASFGLKPILTGPGRVALVGEALISGDSPLPSPGEARLFARSIAEAKRNGVMPAEIPQLSPEARRLQQVYARYEELKDHMGRWDYDDFRSGALDLLERGTAQIEADLVVVDGFRELGVLELRLLQALSREVPVWVSLPEAPPGFRPDEVLGHSFIHTQTYRAPNPVSEARWVLRSIKRDLALGMPALEIAVIAPESRIPALLTLADEYGLPLISQLSSTAAETPEGRLLLELLDLPDYPTPTRLLAVPDLAPLGRVALERSLVGPQAITRLALELGMQEVWTAWLSRLKLPGEEGSSFAGSPQNPALHPSLAWANELLDSLPEVRHSPRRATLMERALEAHRIAIGPDFRHWWAALLAETYQPHRPPGGVALLTPTLASGQRWKKLYLTYGVEGAYSSNEQEDYFIPEELRAGLEQVMRLVQTRVGGLLPRRFLGRDRLLLEELKTRADEVIITYPEASQEGPLEPEPVLIAGKPAYPPRLPPASLLEMARSEGYQAPLSPVNLGRARVEALRRYSECGLQYWAFQFDHQPTQEWWRQWVREFRKAEKLVPARLQALAQQFPQAEGWMRHHQESLSELNLGFRLEGQGLEVRLDAVLRKGTEAHLYRFVAPNTHPEDASQQVRHRWSERWAAGYLLSEFAGRINKVYLWSWPVLGDPVLVYDKPVEKVWGVLANLLSKAQEVHSRYKAGVVEPNPGFRCRSCSVRDVCREGKPG